MKFLNHTYTGNRSEATRGFKKTGLDDTHFLLAGGGSTPTKLWATNAQLGNYLPTSGGNITGGLTIQGNTVATQSWVTSQGYLTSTSLSGYATQNWVSAGYQPLNTVLTKFGTDLISAIPNGTGLVRKIAGPPGNPWFVLDTNIYLTQADLAGYVTDSELSGYATENFVNTSISNLVDSSPATLDTLNELAAALGDDPNFATTMTNLIGTKENAFSKNTAFNKDFGTTVGTVAQGNDSRINNGQNAYDSINNGLVHRVNSSFGLNNASNSHVNKSWFDYDWAGEGYAGSVINFSGLNGNYSTELFAAYAYPDSIGIRSKNGDNNTWNDPKWLWHSGNFNPGNYASSTHTHSWSDIVSGKPTTLAGYGITNAYTKTETDDKFIPKSYNSTSAIAVSFSRTIMGAGRFKIRLPYSTISGKMLAFTIRMYGNYTHTDIACSGYLYDAYNQWYLPSAKMIVSHGLEPNIVVDVIFGRDTDGTAYVSIPKRTYDGIAILDVVGGFYPGNYGSGWAITEDDTTPNIATTINVEELNRVSQLSNDAGYINAGLNIDVSAESNNLRINPIEIFIDGSGDKEFDGSLYPHRLVYIILGDTADSLDLFNLQPKQRIVIFNMTANTIGIKEDIASSVYSLSSEKKVSVYKIQNSYYSVNSAIFYDETGLTMM